jgi:hypothetical protein
MGFAKHAGFATPGRAVAGHALAGAAMGAGAGYGFADDDDKLLGTGLGALGGAALGGGGKALINRVVDLNALDDNHMVDAIIKNQRGVRDEAVGVQNVYLDKLQKGMDNQPYGSDSVKELRHLYDASMEDRSRAEQIFADAVGKAEQGRVPAEKVLARKKEWF